MKNILRFAFLVFGTISFFPTQAQFECGSGRYAEPVFPTVDMTEGIQFGSNIQATVINPNAVQDLFVDIYEPAGDTMAARPLIIFAFGGAFVAGSRKSPDIVYLCEHFARMGYVCAAIDYRLSTDLFFFGSPELGYKAVLKATHDYKAAVRFFRKDAATSGTYRIDPDRIYAGGVSAGAFAALHTAYFDKVSEIPAKMDTAGVGGIEGLSGNPGYSSEVSGVINLAGALGETSWLEAGDVPLVSMHGTADEVVPYGKDTISLFNINLPVYGSAAIHPHALSLGVGSSFYTFQGAGHVPFVSVNGIDQLYMDTTFAFIRDFMHEQICGFATANDLPFELTHAVYPNPFRNEFRVKIEGVDASLYALQIVDGLGKEIATQVRVEADGLIVNTEGLSAGLYYYFLRDKEGRLAGNGKLLARE